MAQVTEVRSSKKIQVELGVPFFILIAFVAGTFVLGTIYFGVTIGGGGEVAPKKVVQETQNLLTSYIKELTLQLDALPAQRENGTGTEAIFVDEVTQQLSQNVSLLGVAYYSSVGELKGDLHKSRISGRVLGTLKQGNLFLPLAHSVTPVSASLESIRLYLSEKTDTVQGALFWVKPFYQNDTLSSFVVAAVEIKELRKILGQYADTRQLRVTLRNQERGQELLTYSTFTKISALEGPNEATMRTFFTQRKHEYGYESSQDVLITAYWEEVENTSWNVSAEVIQTVISNKGAAVYGIGAVVIIIFILLVFYFLIVFSRKLLRPLQNIENVLHYYRTGDYSEVIKVGVENELREVAELLNTMAHDIENNTSEHVARLKKSLDRRNTDTKLLIEKDVELRSQGEKLKELDSAKSMFVSVAAHQMRTPLAAVKWAIQLVRDGDVGPVNAEQKEYLEKGYKSTVRMIELINDLLDVDKIESDKFTYEFVSENLKDIVQEIVDDLLPLAKEKGVHMVFEFEEGETYIIAADTVKLRNALQNLIDNAIKYTIGGGDVHVKLEKSEEIFKLAITDNGIGIPDAEQSKVFGKFFRAKNAVSQQTDGSGLGLFIVKKIIEKHGGSISFESREKQGTTFFIEIPIEKK